MRFLSKMSVFYQSHVLPPIGKVQGCPCFGRDKKISDSYPYNWRFLLFFNCRSCCSLDAYPDTPCFVWACLASQRKLWHLYSCRVVTLDLHTHSSLMFTSDMSLWIKFVFNLEKRSVLWFQCSLFTLSVSVVKVKKTVTLPRLAGFRGSFSRSAFLVRLCRAMKAKKSKHDSCLNF